MKIICLQINKKLRNTCNPILHAELVFTYYAASILRVKTKTGDPKSTEFKFLN